MKESPINPQDISEFKIFLSKEILGPRKKLTGDQMSKLKKPNFNQYIKKIKYYAQKDLHKIKEDNVRMFYKRDQAKNYEDKQEANTIVNKLKPPAKPEVQPSHYYYGKAQIASMREFIFLAQECYRLQKRIDKVQQRKRNQIFIKKVQERVQGSQLPAKILNLRLTVKSAEKLNERIQQKKTIPHTFSKSGSISYHSCKKSLNQTNFTLTKNNSTVSLRVKTHK